MSTDAKTGQSEIAAALHEMVDGFHQAGVLPNAGVDNETRPVPAPHHPEGCAIVSPVPRTQG
jgi:hypothetical protein